MKPLIKINHSVYWRCYTTNKSVNKKNTRTEALKLDYYYNSFNNKMLCCKQMKISHRTNGEEISMYFDSG